MRKGFVLATVVTALVAFGCASKKSAERGEETSMDGEGGRSSERGYGGYGGSGSTDESDTYEDGATEHDHGMDGSDGDTDYESGD